MAQWLLKEEPEHYSYDQLAKDRKTVWAGVRNPLAQKHLRSIRKGDRIFYYHTGKEKAVVAEARAGSDAYPDPSDASGKLYVVDVVAGKTLPRRGLLRYWGNAIVLAAGYGLVAGWSLTLHLRDTSPHPYRAPNDEDPSEATGRLGGDR